jgi:hypothetical protein
MPSPGLTQPERGIQAKLLADEDYILTQRVMGKMTSEAGDEGLITAN